MTHSPVLLVAGVLFVCAAALNDARLGWIGLALIALTGAL